MWWCGGGGGAFQLQSYWGQCILLRCSSLQNKISKNNHAKSIPLRQVNFAKLNTRLECVLVSSFLCFDVSNLKHPISIPHNLYEKNKLLGWVFLSIPFGITFDICTPSQAYTSHPEKLLVDQSCLSTAQPKHVFN